MKLADLEVLAVDAGREHQRAAVGFLQHDETVEILGHVIEFSVGAAQGESARTRVLRPRGTEAQGRRDVALVGVEFHHFLIVVEHPAQVFGNGKMRLVVIPGIVRRAGDEDECRPGQGRDAAAPRVAENENQPAVYGPVRGRRRGGRRLAEPAFRQSALHEGGVDLLAVDRDLSVGRQRRFLRFRDHVSRPLSRFGRMLAQAEPRREEKSVQSGSISRHSKQFRIAWRFASPLISRSTRRNVRARIG